LIFSQEWGQVLLLLKPRSVLRLPFHEGFKQAFRRNKCCFAITGWVKSFYRVVAP
jgi:hypothetical protein